MRTLKRSEVVFVMLSFANQMCDHLCKYPPLMLCVIVYVGNVNEKREGEREKTHQKTLINIEHITEKDKSETNIKHKKKHNKLPPCII
jgi:hypothetical protein